MSSKKQGLWYLIFAMIILGGICLEFIWAFMLEPCIFHVSLEEYTVTQTIFHWALTSISWVCAAMIVLKTTKKKLGIAVSDRGKVRKYPSKKRTLCVLALAACVIYSLVSSYLAWDGSKLLYELKNLGIVQWIFQYMYYAFETLMFFLIIVFAQKAFEKWIGYENFPYGGVIVALTWGLGHIVSKGSVATGCLAAVSGFVYGIIYLLTDRNAKWSYFLLFVCFIL